MLAVLIAGGRDFNNYCLMKEKVFEILKSKRSEKLPLKKKSEMKIVSGGASGADTLAEVLADEYKFNVRVFKADWSKYGKRAGYLRNTEMAEYLSMFENNLLIAFWDKKSKGTANMIEIAKKFKIPVEIVYY